MLAWVKSKILPSWSGLPADLINFEDDGSPTGLKSITHEIEIKEKERI